MPLTLKHRSGRGKPPRNSGNFASGSQIFSHEMLVWFSGVKMPFITWGFLFFLAYIVILSATLNENNVQLICMRTLAWAWHWVGFDETKAVNLLMPDGSRHRTIMDLVPNVGDVIRVWNKAVSGLIDPSLPTDCLAMAHMSLLATFLVAAQRKCVDGASCTFEWTA